MNEITNLLSNEFKVSCEIYHHELSGRPIGYKQLIKEMDGILTEDDVKKALATQFDWGIITVTFDDKNRKVFLITSSSKAVVASLYEKYWRKYKLSTMESPLSNAFKVACEIYSYNKKDEDIWADKLTKGMEGILSKSSVNRALNVLYDWQIIACCGHINEGSKSKPCKLITIHHGAKYMVEQLYDHCWEEYRQLIIEYGIPETPEDVILESGAVYTDN